MGEQVNTNLAADTDLPTNCQTADVQIFTRFIGVSRPDEHVSPSAAPAIIIGRVAFICSLINDISATANFGDVQIRISRRGSVAARGGGNKRGVRTPMSGNLAIVSFATSDRIRYRAINQRYSVICRDKPGHLVFLFNKHRNARII